MEELIDIKEYKELKIPSSSEIYIFIIVLFSILSLLLFIFLNSNFDFYYKNNAINIDNETSIIIKSIDLSYIVDNSIININGKNYKYKVKKIESPIIDESTMTYFQNVIINIYGYKNIDNNVFEFKILYGSKNGFEIIKNFILGEED